MTMMTETRKPTSGPLVGLRVLDLTRLLPGPLGTMLLADMGAEVIRIEHPKNPDYVRMFPPHQNGESLNYIAYNRSKKSVLLDYTTEEGLAQLLRLVDTADVLVEQFRPGFLEKFGLDYVALSARNPRLVYVSVTGYGQTGPYAPLAGHDLNYVAVAGVLGLTGEADGPPTIPGVQLADVAGGSYGLVMGTLAALYARVRTGRGQHVDVSMTDMVMPLLSVAHALHAGGMAPERGKMPLSGGLPNYGVYRCADERYVALGTLEPKFWQKFCTLLSKPEWGVFMLPQNAEQLAEFKAKIATLFLEQERSEWVAWAMEHDVPLTPINDLADLAYDPHLQAREMVRSDEHPVAGPVPALGVPLKFSDTPAHPAWPAPALGEDTDAVLGEA